MLDAGAHKEKSASPSAHSIRRGFIGVTGDIISDRGDSTTPPSMFFRHDELGSSWSNPVFGMLSFLRKHFGVESKEVIICSTTQGSGFSSIGTGSTFG
mmetsp:Transcript_29114/g.54509  ORF Transcript_29114/g.54509 Transcript_29114/m.54509 type:complete len:98 (+) Transcript_29114:331-624(+)